VPNTFQDLCCVICFSLLYFMKSCAHSSSFLSFLHAAMPYISVARLCLVLSSLPLLSLCLSLSLSLRPSVPLSLSPLPIPLSLALSLSLSHSVSLSSVPLCLSLFLRCFVQAAEAAAVAAAMIQFRGVRVGGVVFRLSVQSPPPINTSFPSCPVASICSAVPPPTHPLPLGCLSRYLSLSLSLSVCRSLFLSV
jgi:hypothetical protein